MSVGWSVGLSVCRSVRRKKFWTTSMAPRKLIFCMQPFYKKIMEDKIKSFWGCLPKYKLKVFFIAITIGSWFFSGRLPKSKLNVFFIAISRNKKVGRWFFVCSLFLTSKKHLWKKKIKFHEVIFQIQIKGFLHIYLQR